MTTTIEPILDASCKLVPHSLILGLIVRKLNRRIFLDVKVALEIIHECSRITGL